MSPLEQLLSDLDESLGAEGFLPLYTFSWWLRGQGRGLTELAIGELSRQAYDIVTHRYDLHLEWFESPHDDPTSGRVASPDAVLDFDVNPSAAVNGPILALVPDS